MNEYTNLVGYTHTHKVESLNLVWTVSAINMTLKVRTRICSDGAYLPPERHVRSTDMAAVQKLLPKNSLKGLYRR